MKMSGRRPRGRPHIRWTDQVKRDVERRGRDWRLVDKIQEWAYRDRWRLLHKRRPTSVEIT
jgi:hypothetical protein